MEEWIDGAMEGKMAVYTKLRNINRGYMKLDVWQKSVELFRVVWEAVHGKVMVDYKLRSQISDSAQSVSSNIAEGYSRRSIHEYLQYLYIALASLAETLTRAIGLRETAQITEEQFQEIDRLHYEVENKLINLVRSLEAKRDSGTWVDRISDDLEAYHP